MSVSPFCRTFIIVIPVILGACERQEDAPPITPAPAVAQTAVNSSLPTFEDFPAEEIFAGTPAAVNLASHPDANMFRTRLTEISPYETRFAGHYRIVEIGCGTACQSIWAVDLIDGTVYSLFTASSGKAYRPDSRLIVMNDVAFFEDMLDTTNVAEVEDYMATYGAPQFWVEEAGRFMQIAPYDVGIDPVTKQLIGITGHSEGGEDTGDAFCGINGEIGSAGFSTDGKHFLLSDAIGGFPLLPEARMFIVDVATNECVPGGCEFVEGEFESEDDEGVLLSRLEKRMSGMRERLGLVPPQGAKRFAPRELADDLVAYDLGDGTIEVLLRQDALGEIGDWKSSLRLEVRAGDTVHELDSLERYRDDVEAYRLGDLYLSPDGRSVAIIIEMKYEILGHAPTSYCRFMVETANLF